MSNGRRRNFDDTFKVKVVLEALREEETISAIASKYGVHPNQIGQWKKQFLNNATQAFSGNKDDKVTIEKLESEKSLLQRKIGEQTMDLEYLKKNCKKLGLI